MNNWSTILFELDIGRTQISFLRLLSEGPLSAWDIFAIVKKKIDIKDAILHDDDWGMQFFDIH